MMLPLEAKRAAIEQWTADPCGYDSVHEPGTRLHMQDLDRGLRDYAPWMDEILDYAHTSFSARVGIGRDREHARPL
jgi:hypothetical protein